MATSTGHLRTLVDGIRGHLMHLHTTAAVLFHHVVAEHLGLGPADHKCFDLLRQRGTMTASELAAITGLTTGALTGVVARLESRGFLRREQDPADGRKQILHLEPHRMQDLHAVFHPIREDLGAMLKDFDAHQLSAIAAFLTGSTDLIYRHMALLRGQALYDPSNTTPQPAPTAPGRHQRLQGRSHS
jgi:DNA-binding MarR family transcriptional regulator